MFYKTISLLTAILLGLTFQLNAQQKAADSNIKVHGDWTITVKNKDGEVVKQRTFENSLSDLGAGVLTDILASEYSMGSWEVHVTHTQGTSNGVCQDSDGNRTSCTIVGNSTLNNPEIFETLSVSTPESGSNENALVLTGNFTAAVDGSIDRVNSGIDYCPPSTNPSNCTTGEAGATVFTTRNLDSAISVSTNQQVTVTVVISFS